MAGPPAPWKKNHHALRGKKHGGRNFAWQEAPNEVGDRKISKTKTTRILP